MANKRANAKKVSPKKRAAASKSESKKSAARRRAAAAPEDPLRDVPSQPFLEDQLHGQTVKAAPQRRPALAQGRVPSVASVAKRIKRVAPVPVKRLPAEITQSVRALEPPRRSIHGSKFSLAYFPGPALRAPCADRFGYMSSQRARATKLPFTAASRARLEALGAAMAAPGRDTPLADSMIDAGMTYIGQFIDHDITLDVSSSLDVATDATTIHNMRSPSLDLDSVYGRGPALDPFLYEMPAPGDNPTAIKLQLGTNLPSGPGGPGGPAGMGGMVIHTDRDVPRTLSASNTAIIGDPRNDENLIVVQFHHAMLRFHNAVVDMLLLSGFTGDVFVEAKRIVTRHYQWAVINDFVTKMCGAAAVSGALASVSAPLSGAFRMPVEFSVAAYRFGHSMIRDTYWVNFNFPNATLAQVFEFNRNPHLPVRTNWVVDFNAFLPTGVPVPVFNKARKIDTALATGLTSLPGFSGLMAELAKRNLLRGLALGLPSGQGMAKQFGITPLTGTQLSQGLPAPGAGCPERRRQSATQEDAAVVLHTAGSGGPEQRRTARTSRRTDRRRDVRAHTQAGPRLVPQCERRLHSDTPISDSRRLHLHRPHNAHRHPPALALI